MKVPITKEILDVRVSFGLDYPDVMDHADKYINDGKHHIICTVNPEFIIDAQQDDEFRKILNNAELCLPDGSGVLFANYYLSKSSNLKGDLFFPIRSFVLGIWLGMTSLFKQYDMGKRVTGVDMTLKLCELAAEKKYSVFFLGGRYRDNRGNPLDMNDSDMAKDAAEKLKERFPSLRVVGATSAFNRDPSNDEETIKYIRACMEKNEVDKIDLLFIAYNHRYQEKWLSRNISNIPASVGIGIGGTFDFIVGFQQRAGKNIQRHNLEWLYRLIKEPWRFRRILKAFPLFPIKIFLDSIN